MIKRIITLLGAITVSVAIARAGDVKVKASMTTGPEDEPTTSFASDTPKLYAIFQTEGISAGDKVRGALIAEDVGDVAPANTEILSKTLTLEEDTSDGDFNFSKPNKGWPPGKYRIDIYVNDKLATKAKFVVTGGETSKKKTAQSEESEESAGAPDEAELKSITDNSILSFGRAIKKKDFSGFYKEIASIWQKQTSPEKLGNAFSGFYGQDIDVPAAIKGKEPVFDDSPETDSDGVLKVEGYYPTKPNRIVFTLKYLKEGKDWKLVGINVNLKE